MRGYLAILAWVFVVAAEQVDNFVVIENSSIVEANDEYFSYVDLNVVKLGKGVFVLDGEFDLLQDVPNTTVVTAKICQFINDECTPVLESTEKNICKFLHDEFGDWFPAEYLSKQNFISQCPIRKGNYGFKKFRPIRKNYPLAIFWKRLRTELFFLDGGRRLLHLYWQSNMLTDV